MLPIVRNNLGDRLDVGHSLNTKPTAAFWHTISGLRVDLCGPSSAVKWLRAPCQDLKGEYEDGPWMQSTHRQVLLWLYLKLCVYFYLVSVHMLNYLHHLTVYVCTFNHSSPPAQHTLEYSKCLRVNVSGMFCPICGC